MADNMIDYKERFYEASSKLLDLYSELKAHKNQEEKLDFLFEFRTFVNKWEGDVIELRLSKASPQRIKVGEELIENLMKLYNKYADFYFESVIYRRKLYLVEKELMELRMRITELTDENNKFRMIDEFLNT